MNGLISIFLCLIVFSINVNRSIYSSFLKSFSLVWLFYLVLYFFYQDRLVEFSDKFDFIFGIFFLTTCSFYLLISILYSSSRLGAIEFRPVIGVNVFYGICLVLFFFSFFKFLYFVMKFGLTDFRGFFLDQDLSMNIGLSFPFIAGAYFISDVLGKKKIKFSFLILMFFLALMSTSKIFIVIALIFFSGFYKANFIFKFRKIFLLFVSGFGLFSIIHISMNKIANPTDGTFLGVLNGLIFTLVGYLIGGLAVFQDQLNGYFHTDKIYNNVISFLLNKPDILYNSGENGWVRTGEWLGNVYSGFSSWYSFGGAGGIFFLGALVGTIYAFLNFFSKKSIAINFVKIFSFYPLIFFVFNDTFVEAAKMWIAFVVVAFFISITNLERKIL